MHDRRETFDVLQEKTKPLSVQSYFGEYPDLDLFQTPWELCHQIGRGQAVISTDSKPIQSSGILGCSMFVIKNEKTQQSAAFHIDAYNGTFNDQQTDIFIYFMEPYLAGLSFGNNTQEVINLLKSLKDPDSKNMRLLGELTRRKIPNNDFKSRFIYGTASREHRFETEPIFLKPLQIPVSSDILVNTGQAYWEIVFEPGEERILVNAKKSKLLLEYHL